MIESLYLEPTERNYRIWRTIAQVKRVYLDRHLRQNLFDPFFLKLHGTIHGCWLMIPAHKSVEIVLRITGFNKMASVATLRNKIFNVCNKRLQDI